MALHKFVVGQKVRFSPDLGQAGAAGRGETFTIVRLLPEAAGLLQYHISSDLDGHARVVREEQLADL
jgi:hypothetical protein